MNAFNFNIELNSTVIATLEAIANGASYSHCIVSYNRAQRVNTVTCMVEYTTEYFSFRTGFDGTTHGYIALGEFEDLEAMAGSDGYRSENWGVYKAQYERLDDGVAAEELAEAGFDMAVFGQAAAQDYITQLADREAKTTRVKGIIRAVGLNMAVRRLMAEGFKYEDIMQYA